MNAEAAIAVTVAACAALVDVRTGRIPDALTLVALGAGLGMSKGLAGLASALLGAGVALAACMTVRRLGGGDVKLLIALGALLGALDVLATAAIAYAVFLVLPPKIVRPAGPPIFIGVAVVTALEFLC